MENIVVIADVREAILRHVSFEMVTKAVEIAQGAKVTALVLGHHITESAAQLLQYGVHELWTIDDPSLQVYQPQVYATTIEEVLKRLQADVVFMAHSALYRDLAPRLAAKFDAGLASDVIALTRENNAIYAIRPIYAGKAFAKIRMQSNPVFITVRPNNLEAVIVSKEPSESIVTMDIKVTASLPTIVKDVVQQAVGKVDLTEAKIIVSGGRGVQSERGFDLLYELAQQLGAAVGASRAACDAGYCDYALQIGQTGKVVTPDLYIACGISGAIQHLAGMSNAKVIVAINKDPEAPIFKVANYGIVGDLFEVVPVLTEALKSRQVNGM